MTRSFYRKPQKRYYRILVCFHELLEKERFRHVLKLLFLGFLFALGTILGSFIGGTLVFAFKWKTAGIIKFCGATMLFAAALSPGYLLYCDNILLAGVA